VWSGGTAVLVAGINGVLFRRMLAEDAGDTVRLPPRRRIARFSSGQTAVGLVAWVPDFLVPLLVLRYAGDAANAYYYAAWTVGFSSRLLAMNLANALTAEGAYGENSMRDLVRSVGRLGVLVLLPVMVVLIAGAGLVLRVFGADYSEEAAPLLRLFAIGLVPFCIATIVIAYERVLERFAAALAVNVVGTATTLGLDVLLIPSHGITGAGWGWLGGQVAAAVVALATLAGGRVARGPAHPVTASRGDLGQSPAP
jgi:O-antigen/teichoic acid export membrane protein